MRTSDAAAATTDEQVGQIEQPAVVLYERHHGRRIIVPIVVREHLVQSPARRAAFVLVVHGTLAIQIIVRGKFLVCAVAECCEEPSLPRCKRKNTRWTFVDFAWSSIIIYNNCK